MKINLYHDHFQNYKQYNIPKAQLIIADIPYNVGKDAYASSPTWYKNGKIENGESNLANKAFFDTDLNFNLYEFLHFCSKMLKKESKKNNTSPCMVVFCDFWDQFTIREIAKKHGLNGCINLVFQKSYSSQVLKANMRIVSNGEYGLLLYRDKLPKFNNNGKMIYNIMPYRKTLQNELMGKIHPTQKPVDLLEYLIKIFTDENDVVIDPCAGSGSTLIACVNTNRKGYGFEIKKNFYQTALEWNLLNLKIKNELKTGYSKTLLEHKTNQQKLNF